MAANDFPDIRKALEKRLFQTLGGIFVDPDADIFVEPTSGATLIEPSGGEDEPIAIAWENVDFNPMDGLNEWVRSQIDVVGQRPSAVGVGAMVKHEGLFLVDCFVRYQTLAAGPAAADLLAQRIQDAFAYGTILTHNGKRVYIRNAQRSGGRTDSPWFFVPVSIEFYSYI